MTSCTDPCRKLPILSAKGQGTEMIFIHIEGKGFPELSRYKDDLVQDSISWKSCIIRDPGHLGWQPANLPFAGEAARRGKIERCTFLSPAPDLTSQRSFSANIFCNSWNAFGQVLLTPAEPLPLQSLRIMDDSFFRSMVIWKIPWFRQTSKNRPKVGTDMGRQRRVGCGRSPLEGGVSVGL